MSRRFFSIITLSLCGAGLLSLSPQVAKADTPLSKATIQDLRNKVQLILKRQSPRSARKADTMTPGDALTTDLKSFAELRFNDRSLARVGERAVFRFLPNTRTFQLSNGTLLLLIPPKQGTTRVRTPNAAAGIRGSALFVRYNPDTGVTLVGALTNSDIEISNESDQQAASQRYVLKAGQMAVVNQNRIEQIFNFDLRTFYETSEMVKDLNLPLSQPANSDPAIASVQAETAEALNSQPAFTGQNIVENPSFVRLQASSPAPINPALQTGVVQNQYTSTVSPTTILPSIDKPPVQGGANQGQLGGATPPNPGGTSGLPTVDSPPPAPIGVNSPPPGPNDRPSNTPQVPNTPGQPGPAASPTLPTTPTTPPPTSSPIDRPVVTTPVVTTPTPTPVQTPSPIDRPTVTPPVVTAPVITAPVITPPVITTPVITPPVITTPIVTTPVITTPVVTPPVITPVQTPSPIDRTSVQIQTTVQPTPAVQVQTGVQLTPTVTTPVTTPAPSLPTVRSTLSP